MCKPCCRHPIEKLTARMSTNLPSHLGEKERILVSGVLRHPLDWIVFHWQVGGKVRKISEQNRTPRHGVSLPHPFAQIPLDRVRSSRLLCQAETDQENASQYLRRVTWRVADLRVLSLPPESPNRLSQTATSPLRQ